jgi:putative Mn2+ efflux pump MntP
MQLFQIVVIAIGLAMDAFAVSIVSGAAYRQLHIGHALRMAVFFGAFQAVMPLVGYMAGYTVREYVVAWDHWVAFGLLLFVGGKMLFEAFEISPKRQSYDPANLAMLLMLSVATSIDALAVGITLSLITEKIIAAVLLIGAVTFILSYAGTVVGKRFGHLFEWRIEAFGGIVLIAIGVKILLEHLLS